MSTVQDPGRSRFAEPPVFQVVGHVEVAPLTAAGGPAQARAPKGTSIGGQWIDAVRGILDGIHAWWDGPAVKSGPGLVEHIGEQMYRPTLSEGDIKKLRASYVSGSHIDENGEWTAERKAWQEAKVNEFLEGIEPAPEGEAQVWFNGGGPGSGKGSFTNGTIDVGYPTTRGVDSLSGAMDFAGVPNPGAALIDPDAVKFQFPETHTMRTLQVASGDMLDGLGNNWADQSHEESSYIAKMIYAEAQKRNLNIVYDGTGQNIVGKAQEALNNGYKAVHANYMYVEPEKALVDAIGRGRKMGRNVPPGVLGGQYEGMPKAFEKTASEGIFSSVSLFDRNGVPSGGKVPKIFEIRPDGTRKILDEAAYKRFLSSGTRTPDVSNL